MNQMTLHRILGISFLLSFSSASFASDPKEYILGTVGKNETQVCSQIRNEFGCEQTPENVFKEIFGELQPSAEPSDTAELIIKNLDNLVDLEEATYLLARKINKICAFSVQENEDFKSKNLLISFLSNGEPVSFVALDSVSENYEYQVVLNQVFIKTKCDVAIAVQALPDENQDEDEIPVPPVTKVLE